MVSASDIVETMTYVRTCGLNNVMRFRLQMIMSGMGYSPSYMEANINDEELVNAAVKDLGWDYVLDMFEKEGTK